MNKPKTPASKPHGGKPPASRSSAGKAHASKLPDDKPHSNKPQQTPEEKDAAMVQELCVLAEAIVGRQGRKPKPVQVEEAREELGKLIRRCLIKKKDEVLYEALERLSRVDDRICAALKELIDESSGVMVTRDADGIDIEVNAFVIPLVIRTRGGLRFDQCFQDQPAFEQLSESIREYGLESRDAQVVLVSHAYHADELDRISYSDLADMVKDAQTAMSGKRGVAAPAIARSMVGWPPSHFAADDVALELRYLLGFALKTLKDPFYRIPTDELGMDNYFTERAQQFQRWTSIVRPLLRRCLSHPVDEQMEIDFQYQDLFHDAKERGLSEYTILGMMAELRTELERQSLDLSQVHAIIGPDVDGSDALLRVNLYAGDDEVLATAEKPLALAFDLASEIDDLADALEALGVTKLKVARGFDEEGLPEDVRPLA